MPVSILRAFADVEQEQGIAPVKAGMQVCGRDGGNGDHGTGSHAQKNQKRNGTKGKAAGFALSHPFHLCALFLIFIPSVVRTVADGVGQRRTGPKRTGDKSDHSGAVPFTGHG
jgi:hypothetical protein